MDNPASKTKKKKRHLSNSLSHSKTAVQKYPCTARSRSLHVHLQLLSGPRWYGLDLKTQEQPQACMHVPEYKRKHMVISITLLSSDMYAHNQAPKWQQTMKSGNYNRKQQCKPIHQGNRAALFIDIKRSSACWTKKKMCLTKRIFLFKQRSINSTNFVSVYDAQLCFVWLQHSFACDRARFAYLPRFVVLFASPHTAGSKQMTWFILW